MQAVWRHTIRPGLRSQSVLDLHDYHDFHRSSATLLEVLQEDIASGSYRPRRTLPIRVEKGVGISRTLQVPAPEDAVVLQTIVEVLSPDIKKAQPSGNAFYSRSHGHVDNPGELDDTFGYMWWEMWPEFQERILKFTQVFSHLVVTDLADYFDSIQLGLLRNSLSSIARFDQYLLDFLFFILAEYSPRGDYLPSPGVGLPQLNFDAPRLLAHAFLFDADTLLKEASGDNFVRWMDDINIGVQSEEGGRRLVAALDELLRDKGLRLNLTKTRILAAKDGAEHFSFKENQCLTLVQNGLSLWPLLSSLTPVFRASIRKRFRSFWRAKRSASWVKVVKRYIGLFAALNDQYFVRYAPRCLRAEPELRATIFRYYVTLGYSPARWNHLRDYALNVCIDDEFLFSACKVLVDWQVPRGVVPSLVAFAEAVADRGGPVPLVAAIWLLAKYGQETEIEELLKAKRAAWQRNWFAARQVAAVTPRLGPASIAWVSDALRDSGQLEAIRVLANLANLRRQTALSSSDRFYLVPTKFTPPYPFGKILIASEVLRGNLEPAQANKLRADLLKIVPDPICRRYIRHARG